MSLAGHLWTIRPVLRHSLRPRTPPPSDLWTATVDDPSVGPIRLTGRFSPRPSARACLVIVHGLGGDADRHYTIAAAIAADRHGLAHLRLNLRGADGSGEDFYNAGLTADLHAALKSPEIAAFSTIHLLGYSMGGHIVLRAATEEIDPRVRAVAAVCPPLDLALSARAIDDPRRFVYRRHLLTGLKAMYEKVAARRPMSASIAEARKIGRIRDWDERIVAPRYGFSGADAYYAASSVAPRMGRLAVPSLIAAAAADPMIPGDTVRPALASAPPRLDVRWIEEGGHVGFPGALDLGEEGPLGLEPQVICWLDRAGRGG